MTEATIWSVSSLANALKRTVEEGYGEVKVQGELGRLTRASSGHMYFDLKDANAVLHAAWFKGAQKRIPAGMDQGLEVVATGRLSVYPARSEYQMIVTSVELAGIGALLKLIEERKKKLAAEGLFDESRKKPLPFLPRVIGVITSPTGAVWHDILHRLQDRYLPHVLLWPVMVQGEGAAAQVTAAIQGFNALPEGGAIPRPDVLIVARGGGSVEDLMPFNDEALVRAAAASNIPLISAVGHETDWTLIDFAADMRAPTPTGAAELATPVLADLHYTVADLTRRLQLAPLRILQSRRTEIESLRRGLSSPRSLLENLMQRVDGTSERLSRSLQRWVEVKQQRLLRLSLRHPRELVGQSALRLEGLGRRLAFSIQPRQAQAQQRVASLGQLLETLSYRRTLERGYAVVYNEKGQPVARKAGATGPLEIEFADGKVQASPKPVGKAT